jgi:hypothetical protein
VTSEVEAVFIFGFSIDFGVSSDENPSGSDFEAVSLVEDWAVFFFIKV